MLADSNDTAILCGEILILPKDLYIPPEALRIFLETFEGPLDLLLYLIKKQNIDILSLPIAEITRQYLQYIELMKNLHFELAAEYLVMAVMLAEIKSALLLPKPPNTESEEADPRIELIRKLQEYERYKKAAENLDQIPRLERDIFLTKIYTDSLKTPNALPYTTMAELQRALQKIMARAILYTEHHVSRENLSIRDRMTAILHKLQDHTFVNFSSLFSPEEGRSGIIVAFIAVLELLRKSMITIVQNEIFQEIYVYRNT